MSDTRLLTVGEVAERLRLSEASVRRKIVAGEMPGYRLGSGRATLRVNEGELEAWLVGPETRAPR